MLAALTFFGILLGFTGVALGLYFGLRAIKFI